MHIVWAVIAVIALAGGYFWGKAAVPARTGFGGLAGAASGTRGGFGGTRGAGGGGFVAGTITANDGTSLTVQLPNGNSENVFYSSSTQVIKPSPATVGDLTPGTTVMIGGAANPDGSVTAQSIQIRQGNPGSGSGGGQAQ